jgi:putative hydrolase of the HAD superfamily
MRCFIFDLDDTLYPEISYVRSGFRAVSMFLSKNYIKSQKDQEIYQLIWKEFIIDRKYVFNRFLEKVDLDKDIIKDLIYIYRNHDPEISPYEDVSALKYYKKCGLILGIISDGFEHIQKKKIKKLGLEGMFDFDFFTWDHGDEFRKPSPLSFLKIVNDLKISPEDFAYIADNPLKDFYGGNSIGMLTVRIIRPDGLYQSIDISDKKGKEKIKIDTLWELKKLVV